MVSPVRIKPIAPGTRFLNCTCDSNFTGMPASPLAKAARVAAELFLLKLPRHARLHRVEIGANGREHLQHRRHVVHQREVHRLDLRPERKTAIGDHQRVGVTHPGQQ